MRMGCRTALVCGCAMALVPQLAHAETEADAQTAASGDTFGEIIVTAQKRSESILKVPGAISALTPADIEGRGVTDLASLANQVPSLNFATLDGATFVTIRGVGTAVDNGYVEPSVATYVDGVYLSRSTMGALDHDDLERIEVLRGPQGTLYGRNATGGAINFISRKPTDELEAGATFTVGNYSQVGLKGYVSGPLAPGVRARISGGFEKRDGYVKNLFDGSDIGNVNNRYIRGVIVADLASNVTLDLTAQYSKQTGRLAYQQILDQVLPLPPGAQFTTEPWQLYAESPYGSRLETFIASGTLNWEIGDNLALKSITGYVNHKSHTIFDGDATNLGLINVGDFVRPAETFTQEFNLTGENGPLKWLLGAYYYYEDFYTQLPAPLPTGFGPFPPGTTPLPSHTAITKSYALFTDFTLSITDRLRLIGGLRYNIERKRFNQEDGAIIPGLGFLGFSNVKSRLKSDKLLPKVGLQYDLTSDINLYSQFQIGVKSGGVNINLDATGNPVPYNPEELTAYEAGIKARLAGGAVVLTAAGFFYNYKNLQVFKVVGGTVSLVESADAHVTGLEAEANIRLSSNFKINAAATWLDSRYTNYESVDPSNPAAGVQDLKGQPLTRAPDYTLNLGADWTIPIGSRGDELTLRGEVFHSGEYVIMPFPQPGEPQSEYTTANFYATLALAGDRFRVRGYITNAFNEAYTLTRLYSPLQGAFLGAYAPPRQYGMSVSVKW